MGFRGLFTFRQKCLISQGTSWESAHGHPVATRLTLSCTNLQGWGGAVCKSQALATPQGQPSGLWGGAQVSEIFFFFGYTTCGISVPRSGTEPTPLHQDHRVNHETSREALRFLSSPSDQGTASPGPAQGRPDGNVQQHSSGNAQQPAKQDCSLCWGHTPEESRLATFTCNYFSTTNSAHLDVI